MLDLSDIISITVNSPSAEASTRIFSVGLLLSQNTVISPTTRIKTYTSTTAMISDGFTSDSAEVKAAGLYFGQSPAPKQIMVGVQAAPVSATVTTQTADSTTLVVSSTTGMTAGQSISGTGIPSGTTISTVTNSTTLTLSKAATSSASSGTVTVGGETAVQALSACRAASSKWYIVEPIGASSSDILAMAAYIEGAKPSSVMFATTNDTGIPSAADNNLAKTLASNNYSRTFMQYSTYADVATSIAGYACGASDGTNSFTLMFKPEPGVTPETLNSAELDNIKTQNCNVLVTRDDDYTFLQWGIMANGQFFDEVAGIDMLVADIQTSVINLQVSEQKIPQTDAGIALIVSAIESACEKSLSREFIAPGTWTGKTVSVGNATLKAGDTLAAGYKVMVDSVSNQTDTDRANRVTPPIYVCVKLAGSIQSVVIVANVNR